jgi:hypothetical protein
MTAKRVTSDRFTAAKGQFTFGGKPVQALLGLKNFVEKTEEKYCIPNPAMLYFS